VAGAHKAPRGTYDLLPEAAALRRRIVEAAATLLEGAGFGQIETPAFESTELFTRTVGEATDIVRKEMYTFTDRGGRSLTLRPEGTAPVCRAYIEHGMHKLPQPVKLWYTGPMFRYEAPQSGRFRQHSQAGAEVIGSDDPGVDAELIDLLASLYARLELPGVQLYLTSIGEPEARADYAKELRDFLLSSEVFDGDQRARIELNPLRAFDWEGEEIRAITDQAPKLLDRLGEADRRHFEAVCGHLDAAGIGYTLDPRLVRGLDYYTRTVFEFRCDALGAQSGIGGGGRYDRLVEQIGGEATPAAGWATGLERIAQAIGAQEHAEASASETVDDRHAPSDGDAGAPARGPLFLFALTEAAAREQAFRLISELRRQGVGATMDYGGRGLKGQMRLADRIGAAWVVIIGPEEWSREVATVRDMRSREQEELPLARLQTELLERAEVVHGGGPRGGHPA
jgi:histidyl-tRNA synthetase